ncbi:MAG: methionine synthase [Eggerthellaceae bacterium]|nr:methionine synthase [Eggerthellaceae bacterium]
MPDIHLRFHKDMLVLSGSLDAALRERGFDLEQERELLLVTEPETVLEPLRLESIAGAQCLVLPTAGITRARLAHVRAEGSAQTIANAALGIAAKLSAQHVLAEIGPTGLPLDATSKTSLTANRDQYADAARLFSESGIDALFLNGMAGADDLRCALMGVRKVWDGPVFASVVVDEYGTVSWRGGALEEALSVMVEYEASVAGIQTGAAPDKAADLVGRMVNACDLPVLVQIDVSQVHARDPHDENPYWHPDFAMSAAGVLRAAGAQFLRACGNAVASYTGALVAATMGTDAVR